MEKIKENEFILLKSKDDYSYAHYKMAPLSVKTGFFGTAGEGIAGIYRTLCRQCLQVPPGHLPQKGAGKADDQRFQAFFAQISVHRFQV